jgi:thimet oligopeptidase
VTEHAAQEPIELPSTSDWSDWLRIRCDEQLQTASRQADRLRVHDPADRSGALRLWNDIQLAISNTSAICSLLSQVHPDSAIQSQAEESDQRAQRLATELGLDPAVYAVLAAIDPSGLDTASARMLRLTLRDFKRAGVDRDETIRRRITELADRETVVAQEFSKNIREDVRTIKVTTEQLDGLPDDYIADHPPDLDGCHIITTDYPDIYPFLTFCRDPEARRLAHVAFLSRGWPANDALLRELLSLRAEHAAILGYQDWASYDAEVKMIGDGPAIGSFIDRIVAASEQSALRDRDILLRRMRDDRPEATSIDRADSTYYAEVVRRESFDVDAQELRTYFEFSKVRAGLLAVTGRLFGLTYTEVVDAAKWHDDVAVFDVDLDGESGQPQRLGRIYLDLHPREGKYKHAAQFDLTRGIKDRQPAVGALVCNMPRGLMEHSDVVTLFHEFGHLVHHVLAGRHEWVRFSGVATEWDFVEAPSQMLEEWAWDADILGSFATNSSDEPIPPDLVARMRAAHDFGRGYACRTQMFYASVSYDFHRLVTDDLTERVKELQSTYDVFPFVDGTHFHTSFGHLAGYTSAYYTYMWSLVIAKDLFSAFDPGDLFAVETAQRYRDTILAAGGSADAAELVERFLGRPYSFDAFARWLSTDAGSSM